MINGAEYLSLTGGSLHMCCNHAQDKLDDVNKHRRCSNLVPFRTADTEGGQEKNSLIDDAPFHTELPHR